MTDNMNLAAPSGPLGELHRLDRAYDLDDKKIGNLLSAEDKQGSLEYIQASLASLKIRQEQVNLTADWIEAEMYYLIDRFKLFESETTTDDDGSTRPFRSFTEWAIALGAKTRISTLKTAYRFRRRFAIEPDTSPERWEKLMSITNLQKVEAIEGIASRDTVDMLLTLASGIGMDDAALTYHELRQLRLELKAAQRVDASAIEEAYIQVKQKMSTTFFRGWGKWAEIQATARGLLSDPNAYVTIEITPKPGGKRVDIVIKED